MQRRRRGKVARRCWTLLAVGLLAGGGCAYQPPAGPKLPVGIQVENPGHLAVAVVDTVRRSLTAAELSPTEHAGLRWDFQVRFTDLAGIGVRFVELQATVESLSGVRAERTIPLRSTVEPRGTTAIAVAGVLATSNPEEPNNLTGVEELVFLGQDDQGVPVRVTVRVPLL